RVRSETRSAARPRQLVQRQPGQSQPAGKTSARKTAPADRECNRQAGPKPLVDADLGFGLVFGRARNRIVDLFCLFATDTAAKPREYSARKEHRRAAVRKSERGTSECLLRGRNSGRNSDAPGKNLRLE